MLDTDTKKQIDTCRDILVGKLPDPKSQVEQITIALIYKFMDDMDKEAEEWQGKATFFTGDFEKYAWHKIFDPRISSFEMLNLYSESIQKMNENPKIPQLFRDIFKNAYLPYRDPETLKSFLKEINTFHYSHSEKLGDAFEYLLSVLGSQGDAGQFRTPRHLIDFMAEITAPQKGETILDPACGTAGFLIVAYKYILRQNTDKRQGDKLTPDDRKRFVENFTGYDISPDMVRLSLVNMYLHGFSEPHIYEYDTLTSEDHWGESFDVVLANPPFMSPKGGIKPHKRFAIQAKRSEVLFVDYIAEHLNPQGRAAVIVPEGIIFQTQNAYKQLRKMLLGDYLWGVISLPAGVFQPYSGVKTSILLFDKRLKKRSNKLIFVKIDNDGYGLGAQRRAIEKNDLPQALEILNAYKSALFARTDYEIPEQYHQLAHIVDKTKIEENGDYILSGERYRINEALESSVYELVELGEVCEIISGQSPKSEFYNSKGEGLPFYQGKTLFQNIYLGSPTTWTTTITRVAEKDDILMSVRAPVGTVNISTQKICIGRGLASIRVNSKIKRDFLFYLLRAKEGEIKGNGGAVFDSISRKQIETLKIPLPPLSVQEAIVSEIEDYQKIIDGAKQIVENWKPQIKIKEEWEKVAVKDISILITKGSSPKWQGVNYTDKENGILFITSENVGNGELLVSKKKYVEKKFNTIQKKSILQQDDILTNIVGASIGRTALFNIDEISNINQAVCLIRLDKTKVNKYYFLHYLNSDFFISELLGNRVENARANVSMSALGNIKIFLPPLPEQEAIVKAIEEERAIVENNKRLIEIFEQKIKDKIGEVWGIINTETKYKDKKIH